MGESHGVEKLNKIHRQIHRSSYSNLQEGMISLDWNKVVKIS
jgi:hypothetical protein